jgi:hypothetical protein
MRPGVCYALSGTLHLDAVSKTRYLISETTVTAGIQMMIVRSILVLLAAIVVAPALAQQSAEQLLSPQEVERVRLEKKAWVALNMDLSPGEADAFWPIYEGYQKDLRPINLRLIQLVESYGTHYRNNSLTDEIARKLTEDGLAIDEAELKLRRGYFNRLSKALPARKVARYLQLESRVNTQVRYELAANLPLVGDARLDTPGATK